MRACARGQSTTVPNCFSCQPRFARILSGVARVPLVTHSVGRTPADRLSRWLLNAEAAGRGRRARPEWCSPQGLQAPGSGLVAGRGLVGWDYLGDRLAGLLNPPPLQ